jgi:ribonuclease D
LKISQSAPCIMNPDSSSYVWVETLPALHDLIPHLEQASTIGVDLEADSLFHYFEKVCLVQIATPRDSFILDPLSLKDLSSLQPVFSNSGIRKIFHGADYDIRLLNRDFGLEVRNLFDTQLACRFLGLAETGLEAVLRERFQVALNKKFQRADWSQRPLPRNMLEYAALDGRYLIPLAHILKKELEDKSRLTWVEEECRLLSQVRFSPPNLGPLFLKVKGASHLNPRSLTVLEALLSFREREAQQHDRPPFKIVSNEALLELAKSTPLNLEELEGLKILSPKQINRFALPVLSLIQETLQVPQEKLLTFPRKEKNSVGLREGRKIKALKEWREKQAKALGLEPGIVINTLLLTALALKNPQTLEEMAGIPGMKRWQWETFGVELLRTLKQTI